jgi:hypothetical protein
MKDVAETQNDNHAQLINQKLGETERYVNEKYEAFKKEQK